MKVGVGSHQELLWRSGWGGGGEHTTPEVLENVGFNTTWNFKILRLEDAAPSTLPTPTRVVDNT